MLCRISTATGLPQDGQVASSAATVTSLSSACAASPGRGAGVTVLPGPAGRLVAGRGREGFNPVVLPRELVGGAVQLADQAAKVAAAHPGRFGAGDGTAAVPDAGRGLPLGEPGTLPQDGQPVR